MKMQTLYIVTITNSVNKEYYYITGLNEINVLRKIQKYLIKSKFILKQPSNIHSITFQPCFKYSTKKDLIEKMKKSNYSLNFLIQ